MSMDRIRTRETNAMHDIDALYVIAENKMKRAIDDAVRYATEMVHHHKACQIKADATFTEQDYVPKNLLKYYEEGDSMAIEKLLAQVHDQIVRRERFAFNSNLAASIKEALCSLL